MKAKILIAFGIALTYAPALFAQATGTYVGAGLARVTVHIEDMTPETLPYNYLFTGKPIFFTTSQDNSSTYGTWTLFGGYQFNRYFALEAFYQPLGIYNRKGSNRGLTDPTKTRDAGIGSRSSLSISDVDRLKLDGYGLTALATLPVANYIYILGRVGAFYWDGTLDHAITFGTNAVNSTTLNTIYTTDHGSGYSPIFSIGGRIDIRRGFSVRAEWTHISGVGDGLSTGKSDANISSLSAQINF